MTKEPFLNCSGSACICGGVCLLLLLQLAVACLQLQKPDTGHAES
jgi:hypothetical protein